MTAEVAVMNKEAIALAADSAGTFQDEAGQKIFTSVSKIFTLSKYQPVGVMIYGSANLMAVPWETIIKVYRNTLGRKTFKTIEDYASDFLTFLNEEQQLFSGGEPDSYVKRSIYHYFLLIAGEINENVEIVIKENGKVDETAIDKITSQIIRAHFEAWKEAESASGVTSGFKHDFRRNHGKLIRTAKKDVFEKLPLSQSSSRRLTEIAINLFLKFPSGISNQEISGVVIAGFGTEDVFPVLESYSVECKIGDYLKYKKDADESTKISFPTNAAIIPFAQSEMVSTFMGGVAPDYQGVIDDYMELICSAYPQVLVDNMDCLDSQEKKDLTNRLREIGTNMFEDYQRELSDYRQEHYISPVMRVVRVLPKDELAAMAESLINLTSFKRRVSMEEETVGGPIDVAVISKGDGFIWIKRKHYFESDLNQQFLANYYKEGDTNGTETDTKTD